MQIKKIFISSVLSMMIISMTQGPVYAKNGAAELKSVGTSYYVDSINGDDNNDGKSEDEPFKTLSKINQIRLSEGDAVYLKTGSEFNEQLKPQGKGTSENPITISSYGDGNMPIINGGGKIYDGAVNNTSAAVLIENMEHVIVEGLEVTNDDIFNETDLNTDPNNMKNNNQRRIGVHITINEDAQTFTKDQRAWKDITVRNCYVHDVDGDEQRSANKVNGGIGVEVFFRNSNQVYPYFDGVTLESNVIEKVDRTGIKGIRLTELSLNDLDGGDGVRYSAVRASKDKNQAGRNFVVKNNDLKNIAGDGILIDSTIKTVVEHNVLFDHTKRSTVANAGIWCWNTQDVLFQYNESYGGPAWNQDGCSYDCDYNSSGTIYQYNYSHDTPMGFMLLMGGNEMDIVRYNVSQNDGLAWRHFSGNSTTKSYIYNNVFYYDGKNWKWSGSDDLKNNYEFYNNIFYNYSTDAPTSWGDKMDWTKAVFASNVVYEASGKNGNNEIPNAIHEDPQFKNPGKADTKNWQSLSAYELKDTSPLINSGSYVFLDTSAGQLLDEKKYYIATQDLFGNPLYNGVPDIGVHESTEYKDKNVIVEDNATYRLVNADKQLILQNDNNEAKLNLNLQDQQEVILVNTKNGYKFKLLDSGIDNLYLSVENNQVVFSPKETIWQIEDQKNGLVKIKTDGLILTSKDDKVMLEKDETIGQTWFLKYEDSSKSFNCGGENIEGYSSDQEYNETKGKPGRYGDVKIIGTQNDNVYQTAITGNMIGYKFPIKNGSYNITLNFKELEDVQDRTFDILINGEIYKERYKVDSTEKVEEIGNVYSKNGIIDVQLIAAYNDSAVKTPAIINGITLSKCAMTNVNLNINCGSTAIDGLQSDAAFPSNGSGYYGQSESINFTRSGRPSIDGGMPSAMETGREGKEFGYKFKVQPGNYRLKCLFNEGSDTAAEGKRVFDIYVNDELVAKDFDIVKQAGGVKIATDFTKNIKSKNGLIDVKFIGKNDSKALVNAILIDPLAKEETRENILLNKKTVQSSQENENLNSKYLVDGKQATRWGSNFSDNQWVQVDMEKTYMLDTVFVDWTPGAYATKYRVQISTDGEKWEDAAYITEAKSGLNAISFDPVEARYLRIFGETRNDNYGISITELQAFGTEVKGKSTLESKTTVSGDTYTVQLGLKNIYKRYTGMNISMKYNPELLEYVGNEEYLNDDLKFIAKNIDEEKGTIDYTFELTKSDAFETKSEFITFDFKCKQGRSPIVINTKLSDAAAHITNLDEINVFIPNSVDTIELSKLIEDAKNILNNSEEGRLPGQYRKEDIDTFTAAISKAEEILNSGLSENYGAAHDELKKAITEFESSVITRKFKHYYKNYSKDDGVNFELNDSTATKEENRLHIKLNKGESTAIDKDAVLLNEGTFMMKFDIDSLQDQIRFDIKNTNNSRIEIGYEGGKWFWGGALNGSWGNFPDIEKDILYTDKTNIILVKFDRMDDGNTNVSLTVNGNKVGEITSKFDDEPGNYRLWTRYTQKNIYVHEVLYTNAPTYNINVTSSGNGNITLDDKEVNGDVSVYGETDKTFVFNPDEGYEVAAVYVDDVRINLPENKYTFEFIEKEHNLRVEFAKKMADKTELRKLFEKYSKVEEDLYTPQSWKAFDEEMKKANEILNNSTSTQDEIDNCQITLTEAFNKLILKEADYTKVNEALNKASEIDRGKYTEESLVKLDEAISAVIKNLDITKQDEVDAMAKNIEDAINDLEYKKANYSKVNEALKKASEIDRGKYTKESLAKLDEAISAVIKNLDITHQDEVDAMAKGIEDAISMLVEINDSINQNTPDNSPNNNDTIENTDSEVKTGDYSLIGVNIILMTFTLSFILFILKKQIKHR